MNLVRTWVCSPLDVCERILLYGTGHYRGTARKENLSTVWYGQNEDGDGIYSDWQGWEYPGGVVRASSINHSSRLSIIVYSKLTHTSQTRLGTIYTACKPEFLGQENLKKTWRTV